MIVRLLLLVVALIAGTVTASAEPPTLRRGINLGDYLAYPQSRDWPIFRGPRAETSDEELRRLAAAGFDFIRLPVEPSPFLDRSPGETQVMEDRLVDFVNRINAAGMKVMVSGWARHETTPKLARAADRRQPRQRRAARLRRIPEAYRRAAARRTEGSMGARADERAAGCLLADRRPGLDRDPARHSSRAAGLRADSDPGADHRVLVEARRAATSRHGRLRCQHVDRSALLRSLQLHPPGRDLGRRLDQASRRLAVPAVTGPTADRDRRQPAAVRGAQDAAASALLPRRCARSTSICARISDPPGSPATSRRCAPGPTSTRLHRAGS